jgi:hypothetical protein
MRIPKKLRLLGYDWKVVYKKSDDENGGSFDWTTKTITINDRYGESEVIFLHEIIEAILVNNFARYYGNEGNTEFKFIFNHTEFCKIVYDIFQALKDNKLI